MARPRNRVAVVALVFASCALLTGVVPNIVNFTSVPVLASWGLAILAAFTAIVLAFVSIPGSTVSLLLRAGNAVQQETAEGMRVTVKVLENFDDRYESRSAA
jgi:hypothetical protein